MNDQLKAIIEKIKTDGIDNANEQAARIISQAETKAREIMAQAEEKSREIIEASEKTSEKNLRNGISSLNQAGRDVLLKSIKNITDIFGGLINDETAKAFDLKFLQDAIIQIIKNWKPDDLSGLDILLPDEYKDKLFSQLKSKLSAELKHGLEIKGESSLKDGFILSEKNHRYYYDFTASGIAAQISNLLSGRIAEEIKNISVEKKEKKEKKEEKKE